MDMMEDGEQPLLWSAEEPNLYVLVLSLLDDAGQLVEAESCQVRIPGLVTGCVTVFLLC